VKLQEELGDDLQVIFVHSQNATQQEWEAMSWRSKWRGNAAMWTEEPPVQVEGNTLPKVALIGVDGSVLMTGNPLSMGKKLEEAVLSEVKKAKEPPEGTPKELAKAWGLFHKGDLAGALAESDKVGGDDATKAKEEFLARTESKLARVAWLTENGYLAEADQLLAKLKKSAKGVETIAAKLGEAETKLTAESLKAERDAAAALAKLEEKIAKDKPFDEGNVKKLQAIADKHKGTKAGERAAHLVALSKVKVGR
jgi:hypothetical protein